MPNEPLGLPAGSVRAIMTLILLITVCVMCAMHETVPEILQEGFLLSLGMYHLSRKDSRVIAVPGEDEADK